MIESDPSKRSPKVRGAEFTDRQMILYVLAWWVGAYVLGMYFGPNASRVVNSLTQTIGGYFGQ